MKYLVPLCLFAIVTALLFGVMLTTHAQPNLVPVAGELRIFDMSLEPCKFEFSRYSDGELVQVKFVNLADKAYEFDMGDSKFQWLSAGESIDYEYRIKLQGQTVRIPITRLGTGLEINSLILKLVPKYTMKGGDTK